jgi:hypothetical protein
LRRKYVATNFPSTSLLQQEPLPESEGKHIIEVRTMSLRAIETSYPILSRSAKIKKKGDGQIS